MKGKVEQVMRGVSGNNNSDLTEMNRSAVVKILLHREVCSRADLARQTGLTQAAITKIVAALMSMGIVTEVGTMKSSGNRRSIGLKLNADQHKIIGVKFARQRFAVGVFDISGKMYDQKETEYSVEQGQQLVLSTMKQQMHQALREYQNVVAIGLAVPGPYLRKEGRIAVVTHMPAWDNINFFEEFHHEFQTPIFIEHDAKAGAMAEWWFGDHVQPVHSLAYFLVGEGVGAGIIEGGSLLLGAQGTACEIGHISLNVHGPRCECGNYGCLELYCSTSAMLKLAQQSMPELFAEDAQPHCSDLFQLARKGNPQAMSVVTQVGQSIGFGCVSLINAYNPDLIAIGDTMSEGADLFLPIIWEVVRQRTIPPIHSRVKILFSGLTVDPTLYGAAAIATDKVLQLPSAFSRERVI